MKSRYLLRRTAVRSISSQTSAFASTQRSFVTRTPFSAGIRAQYPSSALQKRFASNDGTSNESPAEAESAEETVETEPSVSEQRRDYKEESVASSETADAANFSSVANAAGTVQHRAARGMDDLQRAARSASSDARPSRTDAQDPNGPNASKILYIGNLFFEVQAEQLEREFEQFGKIVNCRIAADPNGMSKG